MARLLARSILVLAALALAPPANAGDCKPVSGFYSSTVQETTDGSFRTAGELWGGLQGTYTFVQTGARPAWLLTPDPADDGTAGPLFYVGTSVVTLKSGDRVDAADHGVIDTGATGKQAALLVVTGGSGAHDGASGFLQLRGALDLASGTVTGDYQGELCTP